MLQSVTLMLRISVHTQQICGLAFSKEGNTFATGGNDNLCCLFDTNKVLDGTNLTPNTEQEVLLGPDGIRHIRTVTGAVQVKEIATGAEKRRWIHGAAVRIHFCRKCITARRLTLFTGESNCILPMEGWLTRNWRRK